MAAEARRLDSPPGMPALYGRAALGALPGAGLLPFVGGRGERLPDLQLELADVAVEPDRLAAYCRVCGFTLRDSLPPTYPHVLSFPLQMRLMADGSFPFPLLGLVHIDNAITQHRPIRVGERVDLAVRAEDLRPHPKGRAFSLIAEARVSGDLVWSERGTILRRGSGDPDAPREPRPDALAGDAPATTEWRLGDDLGRRYAAVSGDRNPIHMHSLSAKAFGFPRAIAHGMWSQARCMAQLEGRLTDSFTTRASFGKPLLLPAKVAFAVTERGDGSTGFALRDARKGTEHLLGDLQP
jgi:acyl dehydratase